MGSDLVEFGRRALRFSRFGHQSRLDVPRGSLWVTPATGHVPSRSSFISPTTASGLSDMGILPVFTGVSSGQQRFDGQTSNGGVQNLHGGGAAAMRRPVRVMDADTPHRRGRSVHLPPCRTGRTPESLRWSTGTRFDCVTFEEFYHASSLL